MTAYLPKIFSTYNNHGATPITHEARKVLLHKAFRASFTLAASLYIGPADAAAGGDLPLCSGRAVIQAVAQGDDGPLPGVEALPHTLPHSPARIPGIQILEHVVIHSNDIHQGQGIAVPAVFHGVGQGDLPLEFLLRPEVHEDLICYPLLTDSLNRRHPSRLLVLGTRSPHRR